MSKFDRLTEAAKLALPGYIEARGGLGEPTEEQDAAADAYARKWAKETGSLDNRAYLEAELAKAKTQAFLDGIE